MPEKGRGSGGGGTLGGNKGERQAGASYVHEYTSCFGSGSGEGKRRMPRESMKERGERGREGVG